MSLLKISGTKIVNEQGEEVILRGAGLGGWMKSVLLLRAILLDTHIHFPIIAWRTSLLVRSALRGVEFT